MFDLKVRPPLPASALRKRADTNTGELQGKAKKGAWQKLVDEGVTPEQAQERYIALVEKLKETYGYDENKQPEAVGS